MLWHSRIGTEMSELNSAIDFPAVLTRRLPAWALGLSLAVHIVVLAGPFLPLPAEDKALPPLVVNFRLPAMVAAAVPVSTPQVQPTPIRASRSTAVANERNSVPRMPVPSQKPAVLAVAGPAPGAAVASTTAAPAAPSALRSETAPPARTAEASPPAVPDAAAMARYARLLGDLLAQQQQYPRLAAMRGWEGEVHLRLQMARKGTIVAVRVVHSSGFEVLDQHAVQLVQSATLPPPPAAYFSGSPSDGSSTDFMIDIPIHYSLKRS